MGTAKTFEFAMILTAHLGALIQRVSTQSKKHMQMHIGESLTWTVCVN